MSASTGFHTAPIGDRPTKNILLTIVKDVDANRDHLIKHLGEVTAEMVLGHMHEEHVSGRYREFNLLRGDQDRHGFEWILLMGLGDEKDLTHPHKLHDRLRGSVATAARLFRRKHIEDFAVDDFSDFGVEPRASGRLIAEGLILGTYRFERYKSEKNRKYRHSPGISAVHVLTDDDPDAVARGMHEGSARARSACLSRDLVNTPAQDCNPESFAAEAQRVADESDGLSCQILTREDMEREGMGLHLAVGRGSCHAPRVAILSRTPRGKEAGFDLALVGKGVTFDSGGYDLKPSAAMFGMHGDMAGAAAVIGAMQAIDALNLPLNVVGLMPLAENLVNSVAYKCADVLKSHKGTTVEIGNTDAEGRLLLADSLSYACDNFKPSYVVDLATLTGAVVGALGRFVSGMFVSGNDAEIREELAQSLSACGKESGELLWQLPLYDDYRLQLGSSVADLSNCDTDRGAGAGAITAAIFLKQFVDFDVVKGWAHLDIAGTSTVDRRIVYNKAPYLPREGATGFGVRTLVSLAEDIASRL